MPGQIQINTGSVVQSATRLKGYNNNIRTAFSSVETAMNHLNPHWDGAASEKARSAFFAIKNAYVTDRFNVMNNFASFLNNQVSEGYIQTEETNEKLAEAFK